jgi:hypothetical protein
MWPRLSRLLNGFVFFMASHPIINCSNAFPLCSECVTLVEFMFESRRFRAGVLSRNTPLLRLMLSYWRPCGRRRLVVITGFATRRGYYCRHFNASLDGQSTRLGLNETTCTFSFVGRVWVDHAVGGCDGRLNERPCLDTARLHAGLPAKTTSTRFIG